MNATPAAPLMLHNGQLFTVENFQNIIQQRDAQDGMIRQMQENYNRLKADYNTLWHHNEYHRQEMARLQQENVFTNDYQMLWNEKERYRTKTEQLQEQVQNLMEMKQEVKPEPIESKRLKRRVKKEVKEKVKTEPVPLPKDLAPTVPQPVNELGWKRKFYQIVTGKSASNFNSLDVASKNAWNDAYKEVKDKQKKQVEIGLIKLIPDPRTARRRKMASMIGEEEIKEEIPEEEEIKTENLEYKM